ncbi:GrpB family protein [Streptomyces albidus (ex Kaewkla and Franco 2022)]|uniref:GrpB family protein n=1 Tax=Streptomyces albidus (ex Kaewkla and Franco 2022) TaxID=722709 RepID=UPI0015EE58A4|nr:GrpB family protein [Streptomyces albidus (ex Kaewkla and Franco 2022)]
MAVDVVEYDPSWGRHGAQAGAELTDALPGLFLDVEHMGSTSVPGLAAKPVIDLMASVATLDDVTADRVTALEQLGYRLQETGMPERFFYHRSDADGRRSHHLHIVTADTWDTRNERLFRDHLRSHPQVAAEYGELKRRAASEEDDGLAYTKRKTELIQRVVDHERAARGLPLVPVWEE